MRSTLAVLLIAFGATSAAAQATPAPAPAAPPVIVTHGEAVLKRAPDRAWITVATETRDSRAAEARRLSAEAMTAVQNALKAAGVAADAIRTTGYSLAPEVEWVSNRSRIKGYLVTNQIEVRVDDLDTLPDTLDAADSARSTMIRISGPRFDLKDATAAEAEALGKAVEAAMARALAIAGGAQRTLGPIVRIEEQNFGPAPPRPMMMAARAAEDVSTPITPGEIEVRAQVTLTIEIRD